MKKIYTIGRDEGCDIVIPDTTDVISRLHATLRIESGDKIFLIDQSLNGTYVNGMKMSSNVEIPISRNDVISFAHIYNLDWSLVPKRRNRLIKIFLILLLGFLVAGGVYMAARNFIKPEQADVESYYPTSGTLMDELESEEQVVDEELEDVYEESKVREEAKSNNQPKPENEETPKAEKQEEVYNPIY